MKQDLKTLWDNADYKNLLFALALTILTIILTLLFPRLGARTEVSAAAGITILLIAGGAFLLRRKSAVWISLISFLVLMSSLFILDRSLILAPKTAYLIVDASAQGTIFPEFSEYVIDVANNVDDDRDLGLMMFGGNVSGVVGCNDIAELIQPQQKFEAIAEIDGLMGLLEEVQPQGPQTIQASVRQALISLHDAGRPGPHRIYIITTGTGIECGEVDRAAINLVLNQYDDFKYELVTIAIGITEKEEEILASFSDLVQLVERVEDVPNVVSGLEAQPFRQLNAYYGN